MAKYLYNGIGPLPDIFTVYTPELQKSHPFAVMQAIGLGESISNYWLRIFSEPNVYVSEGTGIVYFGGNEGTPIASMLSKIESGTWTEFEDKGSNQQVPITGSSGSLLKPAFWSNTDIALDGTLYLAASDPVPVSPVKLNPALLVQGFFTGQALRRSRK